MADHLAHCSGTAAGWRCRPCLHGRHARDRRGDPHRSCRRRAAVSGIVPGAGAGMYGDGCTHAPVAPAARSSDRDFCARDRAVAGVPCPLTAHFPGPRGRGCGGVADGTCCLLRRGRCDPSPDGRAPDCGSRRGARRLPQPYQLLVGREPLVHGAAEQGVAYRGRLRCSVRVGSQEHRRCAAGVGHQSGARARPNGTPDRDRDAGPLGAHHRSGRGYPRRHRPPGRVARPCGRATHRCRADPGSHDPGQRQHAPPERGERGRTGAGSGAVRWGTQGNRRHPARPGGHSASRRQSRPESGGRF